MVSELTLTLPATALQVTAKVTLSASPGGTVTVRGLLPSTRQLSATPLRLTAWSPVVTSSMVTDAPDPRCPGPPRRR